jgi:hypothetical protein
VNIFKILSSNSRNAVIYIQACTNDSFRLYEVQTLFIWFWFLGLWDNFSFLYNFVSIWSGSSWDNNKYIYIVYMTNVWPDIESENKSGKIFNDSSYNMYIVPVSWNVCVPVVHELFFFSYFSPWETTIIVHVLCGRHIGFKIRI